MLALQFPQTLANGMDVVIRLARQFLARLSDFRHNGIVKGFIVTQFARLTSTLAGARIMDEAEGGPNAPFRFFLICRGNCGRDERS